MKRQRFAPLVTHRILVTGSRGKSSLVRMIFAGLSATGLDVRGRITGVMPRELHRNGERRIQRNAPGHVEEMRWWLRQIPNETDAIVMENSAVHPDLQHLAAQWLSPTLIIWTNARADHHDLWGDAPDSAMAALLRGIPDDGILLLGEEPAASSTLAKTLKKRSGPIVRAAKTSGDFMKSNRALAFAALDCLGLGDEAARDAIRTLPPDIADFRIFEDNDTCLASAFSANDPESTELLFASLGWAHDETCLLYADRSDRPARLKNFSHFIDRPWRETRILRGNETQDEITAWILGKKVFGCGNVAGIPLRILDALIKDGCRWTIPGA